jgi:DNA-3-methyladenine glycosylase
LAGLITEVEAYIGESDLACHARAGLTSRTATMYGPPGCLYVYFNYGLHWMLNIVTEREGFPAAILIRGIQVTAGLELIRQRRQRNEHLTDGPAKIAQAFAIHKVWNGYDLCDPDSDLFIEQCSPISRHRIRTAPRVGLGSVPEPWRSKRWNFSYTPRP